MDPVDVALEGLEAAAGLVVVLGEMLGEDAPGEAGLVPGDVIGLDPGSRVGSF